MVKRTGAPAVAITGATGLVGSELTSYFLLKGWRVIALVRNPDEHAVPGVKSVRYDLAAGFDESIFKDVDYLVHTAYLQKDRKHPDALEINVRAADRLLAASRKYKLKKTVFMSSMSAHKEAVSSYGLQKLAIEKLFNSQSDVNLRSGLIIGNGGIVKRMAAFMKSKHVVPLIGGGRQPLQIIGVNNLARIIEKALVAPGLHGTFTVATERVYTYKEFYQAIAKRLSIKVFFVPVPFWLLLAMVRVISWLHLPLDVNEDNLWGLKKLRAVDNRQDMQKIGVKVNELAKVLENTELS